MSRPIVNTSKLKIETILKKLYDVVRYSCCGSEYKEENLIPAPYPWDIELDRHKYDYDFDVLVEFQNYFTGHNYDQVDLSLFSKLSHIYEENKDKYDRIRLSFNFYNGQIYPEIVGERLETDNEYSERIKKEQEAVEKFEKSQEDKKIQKEQKKKEKELKLLEELKKKHGVA
jgi:hypothetical protein